MSFVLVSTALALVSAVFLAFSLHMTGYNGATYRRWLKILSFPVALTVITFPLVGVSFERDAGDILDVHRFYLLINSASTALMGVFLFLFVAKESPKMVFEDKMRVIAFLYRVYRFVFEVGIPIVLVITILINLYSAARYF